MKTEKLYDYNAYATTFEGTVISAERGATPTEKVLIFDRTCFFPEAGGQTPDRGTILIHAEEGDARVSVIDVQISDGIIRHTVDFKDSGIDPDDLYEAELTGKGVIGSIDWEHRFSNMQQHTGEHIFSGIVNSRYGYDNVGFHLSDNTVTMDYNGTLDEKQIRETEAEANRVIFRNLPVNTEYPSDEELAALKYRCKGELTPPIRIVTIEGVDTCACCAPHVARTAEVGLLKVISYENYKGGIRLHILCGGRALSDYIKKDCIVSSLSRSFSVPADELPEEASRRIAERGELLEKIHFLNEERLRAAVDMISGSERNALFFIDEVNPDSARRYVNELCASHKGYSGAFIGRDGEYHFIIGASAVSEDEEGDISRDANVCLAALKERFGCKGGGTAQMVQGSINAGRDEITGVISGLNR